MKNLYLVIGASSGYGKAIAEALNDNLDNYVVTAQRRSGINSIEHDVKSPESWLNLSNHLTQLQQTHKIKGIIYSTGIAADVAPINQKDRLSAISVIDVNVIGLMRALELAGVVLESGGVFINVGSIAYRKNYYGGGEYCASKAAQLTLMRTARIEGLSKRVRYCTINPGLGYTEFQKTRFNGNEAKAQKVTEGLRVLDAADVANAVLFMLNVPEHVCISELEITPSEQAEHGEDIRKYR